MKRTCTYRSVDNVGASLLTAAVTVVCQDTQSTNLIDGRSGDRCAANRPDGGLLFPEQSKEEIWKMRNTDRRYVINLVQDVLRQRHLGQ